ncbi:hypothetical protein [Streptomyces doebereineriae]|uniref:Uncharacterized protein n=1 Tax=Streptomyces doebereineriae TaxID=3075528 RepID=A0ABU2VPW8_9ACTN|nr:hypothetical protein [Streptomyces sp. DSM 41640]MDT0487656.1 hypothetical protein [Streptomyces sp. DSM 41640]
MNTIPHWINGSPARTPLRFPIPPPAPSRPGSPFAVINANPYGNGTALFTASGEAAPRLQRRIKVTRPKVVTTRRPQQAQQIAAGFDCRTSN